MSASDQEPRTSAQKRPRVRQRLVPPRLQDLTDDGAPDREADDWARGLHGGKRGWMRGVLGNGLLLFVLLGLPWARGYRRALETRQAYAEFAACLYGGRARAQPGLSYDPEEPQHFAAQWLRAGKDWPQRCTGRLNQLAPASALFVLPG